MIQIVLKDIFYQYDAYHITKAFYPNEEIKCVHEMLDEKVMTFSQDGAEIFCVMESEVGSLPNKEEKKQRKICKHNLNDKLYMQLVARTGREQDWGMLTGIRPTKMAMKKWKELQKLHVDDEIEPVFNRKMDAEVVAWLREYYGVSEEKANLAMEIARREAGLISSLDLVHGFSLYIGIPFCKTRCSYCSFTAYPLDLWKNRIDEYLDALCKELAFVASVSQEKKLNTIYIGGGTPTSLSAEQLDRLLTCIEAHFSYEYLQEITVEAGRPDSITKAKLEIMAKHKVGRISINPQTMQEKTLELIGRKHSVQDIRDVYEVARTLGFENINMDLIVGLPGENVSHVENTLQEIMKLAPDSLTVHSLAMKRASKMTMSGIAVDEHHHMNEMIHLAAKYAEKMGLKPYYLYRQKNMAGNYENVGYAKVDKAGIYNILIMEEKQSIVALGAGATTKIVLPRETDNIVRIENVKDVNEYITRIDEMIERKGEWLWH